MASEPSGIANATGADRWRWRWLLRPSRAQKFLAEIDPSASVTIAAAASILALGIVLLFEARASGQPELVEPVPYWLVTLLYCVAIVWAIAPLRTLGMSIGTRVLVVAAVPVLATTFVLGAAIYAAIWVALVWLLGNRLSLDELGVVVGLEGVSMLDLAFSSVFWLVVILWVGRVLRRIAGARSQRSHRV
jgi:hypothetical protein